MPDATAGQGGRLFPAAANPAPRAGLIDNKPPIGRSFEGLSWSARGVNHDLRRVKGLLSRGQRETAWMKTDSNPLDKLKNLKSAGERIETRQGSQSFFAGKILIMGLPGAGKTTLAQVLVPRLKAVHFNADAVRQNLNKELGFSLEDRLEQARRMGWLCDRVTEAGHIAVADFVCPTPQTRKAFGPAFVVWVDRIDEGRFADTNRVFVPPQHYHVRVTREGSPEFWAERAHSCFELWLRDRPQPS